MEKFEYKNIDEQIYRTVLPNGLHLDIVPKKGFGTYYAVIAVNYGGIFTKYELDGNMLDTPAGVAHYLEHKMFDLPDGGDALALLTANGADANAFTSPDTTAYYFQCTDKFEDNLRILLSFVSTPYFTPATVLKEQGIIAQEISMGDDNPGITIYYNLLKALYSAHPIKDKVIGTRESISQITADTLYNCHKAFYAPSNLSLCIEGDVNPDRIEKIVREMLPEDKASPPKPIFPDDDNLSPASSLIEASMPISSTQFLIGAKFAPKNKGKDLLRQRLIIQLSMRLIAGISSPFYTGLYAKGLLSRDYDYEVDYAANIGYVALGGESSQPKSVLEEFNNEVANVSSRGFDHDAFRRAKRASLGARLRGFEDFDNVCVSQATGEFEDICVFDSIEMLDSINEEECIEFIRENLCPERLALSVLYPDRQDNLNSEAME